MISFLTRFLTRKALGAILRGAGGLLLSNWKVSAAVGLPALVMVFWLWDRANQREAGRNEVLDEIAEAQDNLEQRRANAAKEAENASKNVILDCLRGDCSGLHRNDPL